MLLISIGVLGLLSAMNTTLKGSADPMVRKQAIAVAESLLEEISLKNFSDPGAGGPPCTVRSCWDDVSDYDTYSTTTGIVDIISGTGIPGLMNYNISSVTVTNTTLGGIAAKRITVTVSAPGGESISMSTYRTDL